MGRTDNARRSRSRNSNARSRGSNNNERERGKERRNERSQERERRHNERSRQFANTVTKKDIAESAEAIREYKAKTVMCEICGEPIADMSTAIGNRTSGEPVHFDCVIAKLAETERVGTNDKITYIGNGKFAVLHFDNVHDMRHFTIKHEIEWEAKDQARQPWRTEIAGLYSQIK